MDPTPDWQSMVNVNLSDHEVRLSVIEQVLSKERVTFDAVEFARPGRVIAPGAAGTTVTAPERQAARIDNHDQRLRGMEHRLTLMEIELREICNAIMMVVHQSN